MGIEVYIQYTIYNIRVQGCIKGKVSFCVYRLPEAEKWIKR